MKYFFISIILIYCFVTLGQSSSLNQLNGNGKRQGKWLTYIDKHWRAVKDTNLCVYKVYDEYLNGRPLNRFWAWKSKYRLEEPTINKGKLLNGEYRWFRKNGIIAEKYFFRNGEIIAIYEYDKNGKLEFYYDYTISYDNHPYSFGMYYNTKKESSLFFIFKDGNKGWAMYEWDRSNPKITANPK